MTNWYIKEFSSMTALSIRSLRHYDEIGLLTPSLRMKNGYRLYSSMDLVRAQQVIALKSFGIELQDIKEILDNSVDPSSYFNKQKMLLKEKIQGLQEASYILQQVTGELDLKKSLSISNIMRLIGIYTMSTQHFETYLREKTKTDPVHIELILKEQGTRITRPLTAQELADLNTGQLTQNDVDKMSIIGAEVDALAQKCREEGLVPEEITKKIQSLMESPRAKEAMAGWEDEAKIKVLQTQYQNFNKQIALAMVQGLSATSSSVQATIKEYVAIPAIAIQFVGEREVLKSRYKSKLTDGWSRAFLDDFTPGLVDYLVEAMLFFFDNRSA